MLPPFNDEGVLPPGVHEATWEEVVERFGTTASRRELLQTLARLLDVLRGAGCRLANLNGSFVTSEPEPNDYDLCWDAAGVDASHLDPILLRYDEYRQEIHERYGGDVLPMGYRPGFSGMTIEMFFQLARGRFGFKGIVAIWLGEQNDTE